MFLRMVRQGSRRVLLKDEAAVRTGIQPLLAVDQQRPTADRLQAVGYSQQRRLAAPARTDHGHELAGRDGEVDVAQHFDALTTLDEVFVQALRLEFRLLQPRAQRLAHLSCDWRHGATHRSSVYMNLMRITPMTASKKTFIQTSAVSKLADAVKTA